MSSSLSLETGECSDRASPNCSGRFAREIMPGTNPTVDIGCLAHSDGAGGTTAADPDGLFNELDADANNTTTVAAGALVTTAGLTANATVTGNVGASAATGGTYTGVLTYYCVDDGKETYPQLT